MPSRMASPRLNVRVFSMEGVSGINVLVCIRRLRQRGSLCELESCVDFAPDFRSHRCLRARVQESLLAQILAVTFQRAAPAPLLELGFGAIPEMIVVSRPAVLTP